MFSKNYVILLTKFFFYFIAGDNELIHDLNTGSNPNELGSI